MRQSAPQLPTTRYSRSKDARIGVGALFATPLLFDLHPAILGAAFVAAVIGDRNLQTVSVRGQAIGRYAFRTKPLEYGVRSRLRQLLVVVVAADIIGVSLYFQL